MALLDALGTRLQTDAVGTLGTNIFLGYLPDGPDTAVAVYEDKGFGADFVFGASVSSIDRPLVRVIARAPRNDYPAARNKILAVRSSLGAIRDESISGVSFLCVITSTDPYPMALDGDERAMFGLDLNVWLAP